MASATGWQKACTCIGTTSPSSQRTWLLVTELKMSIWSMKRGSWWYFALFAGGDAIGWLRGKTWFKNRSESRQDTGKASFLCTLDIKISISAREGYLSREITYLPLAPPNPPRRFLTHDGSGSRPVDHRRFRRTKLRNLKGSSVCTNISLFLLGLLSYGTLMETKLCRKLQLG